MDVTQTVILALIQGITEYLPISSSAHLILPFEILGWPDQGLAFDVAVHVGSLSAVLVYFHRTLLRLLVGTWRALIQRKHNKDSRFAGLLIIASLPIIPIGFMLNDLVQTSLRSVLVIAMTTILFGIALWVADRYFRTAAPKSLNWRSALGIGIAHRYYDDRRADDGPRSRSCGANFLPSRDSDNPGSRRPQNFRTPDSDTTCSLESARAGDLGLRRIRIRLYLSISYHHQPYRVLAVRDLPAHARVGTVNVAHVMTEAPWASCLVRAHRSSMR